MHISNESLKIVDNILHKINEERIRIAAQRSAVMPAAGALGKLLRSTTATKKKQFCCLSHILNP